MTLVTQISKVSTLVMGYPRPVANHHTASCSFPHPGGTGKRIGKTK